MSNKLIRICFVLKLPTQSCKKLNVIENYCIVECENKNTIIIDNIAMGVKIINPVMMLTLPSGERHIPGKQLGIPVLPNKTKIISILTPTVTY